MWVDSNSKKDLKGDTITSINDYFFEEVKKILSHKNESNGSAEMRGLKEKFKNAGWHRLAKNGTYVSIRNMALFVFFLQDCQDANKINPDDRVHSEDNTFLVLYKDTSFFFPEDDDITTLDWTKIGDEEPAAVAPAPTDMENNKKRIANGMDILSTAAQEKNACNKIINYQGLPDDVKEDYLHYQRGGVPLHSIFYKKDSNGKETLRRFKNNWTVDPATNVQKELFFIEFPDKPTDGTKRWNYHIQVGGHLSMHIASRQDKEIK